MTSVSPVRLAMRTALSIQSRHQLEPTTIMRGHRKTCTLERASSKLSPIASCSVQHRRALSTVSALDNSIGDLERIGLGTWKSKKGEVAQAVKEAVKLGYKLVDCAESYGNEAEVGDALAHCINQGVVRREEITIVSKVFNNYHGARMRESFSMTMKDLQLDYLDLYLMHWPIAFEDKELPSPARDAKGLPNPEIRSQEEFLDTWTRMQDLVREGKCRAIGVCNFRQDQLETLVEQTGVVPAVNQIEHHPYLQQPELKAYCKANNIQIMAYSPLGSPDSYAGTVDGPLLLQDADVGRIAAAHGAAPAAVLLRWAAARADCVLAKSVRPARLQANLDAVRGLRLEEEEMRRLDALDRGYRFGAGWNNKNFLDDYCGARPGMSRHFEG